jgi:hypothetical protein
VGVPARDADPRPWPPGTAPSNAHDLDQPWNFDAQFRRKFAMTHNSAKTEKSQYGIAVIAVFLIRQISVTE